MKFMRLNIETFFVSLMSITGIEIIETLNNIQPVVKFIGQSIIGILTIILLIKQLRKK